MAQTEAAAHTTRTHTRARETQSPYLANVGAQLVVGAVDENLVLVVARHQVVRRAVLRRSRMGRRESERRGSPLGLVAAGGVAGGDGVMLQAVAQPDAVFLPS